MRKRRLLNRVGAAICRAAIKYSDQPRVLLNSGAVVSLKGVLIPETNAEKVSEGGIGLRGVWVFPIAEWERVASLTPSASSNAFSISDGSDVWAPDYGVPVVVANELGLVRVSCLRVIGKRG